MAENSKIEWTDHTFNPWEGCQHIGPGCDFCYAEARNVRFAPGGTEGAPNWGPGAPRRRTSVSNWAKPLAWQRGAAAFLAAHGRRQRVFCASLADVFDNAVDPQWRSDLARVIDATPDLDWLLLSKRIGNAPAMLLEMWPTGEVPANVFCGATIVNQAEWDRDQAKIAAVSVIVGKGRIFLSMEPLLGPVDLQMGKYHFSRIVGWVICGGESGLHARPMHQGWARHLFHQCTAAGVPFLFKQWGEWFPYGGIDADGHQNCVTRGEKAGQWHEWGPGEGFSVRLGKKLAGRFLDGVEHNGFPKVAA